VETETYTKPGVIVVSALSRETLSDKLLNLLNFIKVCIEYDLLKGLLDKDVLRHLTIELWHLNRCRRWSVGQTLIERLDILLDLVLICRQIIADTQKLQKLTGIIDRRRLRCPAIGARIIDKDCLQIIGRNIRLALTIDEPPLLSCTRLIIDIGDRVRETRVLEGLIDRILPKHPATENTLLLKGEHNVRALNVNTVLHLTLALIGLGAEESEEA
jgi:hypothetical protein